VVIAFSAFAQTANQKSKTPPAVVEIVKVTSTSRQEKIPSTGSVVAIPGIVVKPEVPGRITNIFFKPGDDVVFGTPLVEINPDPDRAQLAQAEADLKLAQLDYDRYAKLYASRVVSKADFDQKQATLDADKAQVDLASANLRETLVKAPFTGRLGLNLVNLGDYVNAGQNIVSLQSLDPIYVNFTVPEIYLKQLAVGEKVTITTDSFAGESFEGQVYAFDPLVNSSSRTINARATVPNKDKKLLPGAFAEVTLFAGSPTKVIAIPETAVVYSPDGNYVYKVIDGHIAKKASVTLGERNQQNIIVTSGLAEGDIIVTAGQLKIPADGTEVILASKLLEKVKQQETLK
jgi:membrane fusion protein (multidrug efflux system)